MMVERDREGGRDQKGSVHCVTLMSGVYVW